MGSSSLIVGIKAIAENFKDQSAAHTNSSYFTMVAVDENMKPCKIPGLILENSDEVRRFVKAKIRKEFKKIKRDELNEKIAHIEREQDLTMLKNENCMVASSI